MRRVFSFLLCLCLLFALFGCTQEEQIHSPVTFYYRSAELVYGSSNGVVATEQREALSHEKDVPYLMAMYLSGPKSDTLAQTFPDDLFMVSLQYFGSTAKIVFSYHLSELTGIDLTVACACITMTVIGLTDMETVQISAAGALLDGHESITMNKDSFLLLDTGKKAK